MFICLFVDNIDLGAVLCYNFSMLYLSDFEFPDEQTEYEFRWGLLNKKMHRSCYDTIYPFFILSAHGLNRLDFESVTILYGGNGSGKTTVLNVIAEKLGAKRDSLYNRSDFFEDYTEFCAYNMEKKTDTVRIITSDDVFDFMLNVRTLNNGIDKKREELFDEYLTAKKSLSEVKSFDDYEKLKKICATRRMTQSQYVRKNLIDNVREHSNGESAFAYFTNIIRDSGLYLLDEPENSLSPERQLELLKYLEDSARFFGCQFIIATHSPFLLSMRGAKIYDLDEEIADVKKWTELKNVRAYYDFFLMHKKEFD